MRQFGILIATVLVSVGLYWGNVGLWFQAEVADEDAFVASTLESFELEGSYDALGVVVAERVLEEYPVLALLGDQLGSLLGALLSTEPFEPALEQIAADLHDRLFNGGGEPITIDLADYEDVILAAVAVAAPGFVDLIPDDMFREYVVFEGTELPDLESESESLRRTAVVAVVLGVLGAVGLIILPGRMWVTFVGFGSAAVLAGGGTAVSSAMTRETARALTTNEAYRVLILNLYDVLLEPLLRTAMIMVIVGVVLLAVGAVTYVVGQRRGTTVSSSG